MFWVFYKLLTLIFISVFKKTSINDNRLFFCQTFCHNRRRLTGVHLYCDSSIIMYMPRWNVSCWNSSRCSKTNRNFCNCSGKISSNGRSDPTAFLSVRNLTLLSIVLILLDNLLEVLLPLSVNYLISYSQVSKYSFWWISTTWFLIAAAYFGQKDVQQCSVVRTMVKDLHFPIDVVVGETIRESDGLAMSSRNRFLSCNSRALSCM